MLLDHLIDLRAQHIHVRIRPECVRPINLPWCFSRFPLPDACSSCAHLPLTPQTLSAGGQGAELHHAEGHRPAEGPQEPTGHRQAHLRLRPCPPHVPGRQAELVRVEGRNGARRRVRDLGQDDERLFLPQHPHELPEGADQRRDRGAAAAVLLGARLQLRERVKGERQRRRPVQLGGGHVLVPRDCGGGGAQDCQPARRGSGAQGGQQVCFRRAAGAHAVLAGLWACAAAHAPRPLHVPTPACMLLQASVQKLCTYTQLSRAPTCVSHACT